MRVVFFVAVMLSMSFAQPQPDFNTQLVCKLSEIMKSPVPTKIEIEVVSQEKLQNEYKGTEFARCVGRNVQRLPMCSEYVDSLSGFVMGMWKREKDPTHLHILLYERSGVDTVIHEYLHWWLDGRTEPKGLLNSDAITEVMAREILASKTFIEWLEVSRESVHR